MNPIVECEHVTKSYGDIIAVNDVSLSIEDGEVFGLVGPNGAGKTTLFNVISGFLTPDRGNIIFKGKDVTRLKPHVIAQRGIVRTFQALTLWRDLTVMNSMRIALHMKCEVGFWDVLFNTPSTRRKEREVDERAMEILRSVDMNHLEKQVEF